MTISEINDIINGNSVMVCRKIQYVCCGVSSYSNKKKVEFIFRELGGENEIRLLYSDLRYRRSLSALRRGVA